MQKPQDLQSVLDEMFASAKDFSFAVVRDWQQRYPQWKREIADAVADWREFEFFVLEDAETLESNELSDTAKSAMGKALARFPIISNENFTDLRELAASKGVARENLPQAIGVSETLMRKIERRYLKNIPAAIESKIAAVLQISRESLQNFFALPSVLPNAARYKSKNAPQTQAKQTFAEAVENDPELTADEKRELLKLE